MKYLITTFFAFALLSACSTTYHGTAVTEVEFKVDGGKSVKLPVTRHGALPAENENYRIEYAGFNASVKKGKPEESQITWIFSFVSKKLGELKSVLVEQVTDSGDLELIVEDYAPVLKNKTWIGRSAPIAMTKDSAPWLYSGSKSIFIFKFTIKAIDGSTIVMYQPSLITTQSKNMFLSVITDIKR